LRIAGRRQSSILWFQKVTLGCSLEDAQLLTKQRGALFWQGLDQVFQHGAQTAHDLNALATEMTNLGNRQVHEVLPIRRAVDEPDPTSLVVPHSFIEVSAAHL